MGLSLALRDRMEDRTVFSPTWWKTTRFGTVGPNQGALWGIAEIPMAVPGGPLSRRLGLIWVLAACSPITDRMEKANPTAGCVQGILCVQKRTVSRTASPRAVWKTHR